MSEYDDRHILARKHASTVVEKKSIVSGSEVLQRRFAYSVRKPRIIDSTGQQQRADHRGYRDKGALVRARLAPVRGLARD
jgi:hypothetical protein